MPWKLGLIPLLHTLHKEVTKTLFKIKHASILRVMLNQYSFNLLTNNISKFKLLFNIHGVSQWTLVINKLLGHILYIYEKCTNLYEM